MRSKGNGITSWDCLQVACRKQQAQVVYLKPLFSLETKLLVQIVTGCSGWHLPPFAIHNLIGTTVLLLKS